MEVYQPFIKAEAIWAKGMERTVNCTCVFTARLSELQDGLLRITASCLYRAFLNGKLVGYGPARAAHGMFRVDEIELGMQKGENFLFIEVAGYNCNSFYTLNQPSFLRAEVVSGNEVVAYTAVPAVGFQCYLSGERVRKVARFSYQRSFLESYIFHAPFIGFQDYSAEPVPVMEAGYGKLLPRRVDYPAYEYQQYGMCAHGKMTMRSPQKSFYRQRYLVNENLVIFPESEWEVNACDTAFNFEYSGEEAGGVEELGAGEYAVFSYRHSLTGFIETELYAEEDSVIYVLFDEVDFRKNVEDESGINVCFWRNDTLNIITYDIKKGGFAHVSFEAYTAKYIKIVVLKGRVSELKTGVRRYENPNVYKFFFRSDNEKLNAIVEAARATLAQNSVDILMDCPSRERAGWLCDSYFSAQAEKLFTGGNDVERNFLENYCYQSDKLKLGDGVLAMCYPADFEDMTFIPNWMMFYMLELYSYFERTGDKELVEKVYERASAVFRYFEKFENEYGLLENLESWVFIEWSKANDAEFIKGVNFPSNMLYAKAMECFGRLYKKEKFLRKAQCLRKEIRLRSFNGMLFEDNLVRQNGELKRCGHTSETCQYYAFYFGIADQKNYPELYQFVFGNLGPRRDSRKDYAEVFVSNAFIGNLLRLDYLIQQGSGTQFLEESKEYYYKMASITGTLWEHNEIQHSLNHGFASYVANMVVKCLVGFCGIDEGKKYVYFNDARAFLPCEIKIPTGNGKFIEVSCSDGERHIQVPEDYTIMCGEKDPAISMAQLLPSAKRAYSGQENCKKGVNL